MYCATWHALEQGELLMRVMIATLAMTARSEHLRYKHKGTEQRLSRRVVPESKATDVGKESGGEGDGNERVSVEVGASQYTSLTGSE
jgi:hypothetical protein